MNKIEYKMNLMNFQAKIYNYIKTMINSEFSFLHYVLESIYEEFKVQFMSSDTEFNIKYSNINLSEYSSILDKFMSSYYIDLVVNNTKNKLSKLINKKDMKNIFPVFTYHDKLAYDIERDKVIMNIEDVKGIINSFHNIAKVNNFNSNPLKYIIAVYLIHDSFVHKYIIYIYDSIDLTICEDVIDKIKDLFIDNKDIDIKFNILKNDLSIAEGIFYGI